MNGKLRLLAQICEAMKYVQDYHPNVLDELREHVKIDPDALELIAHGPESDVTFTKQEELPPLPSLRSKGTRGSSARQPPSPDPRRAGASPAVTDETPHAQRTLAGAHRTARHHAAAPPATSSHEVTSLLDSSPSHGPPGGGTSTTTPLQTAYGGQLALPHVGGSHGSVGVPNVASGQPGAPAGVAAQTSTSLPSAPPGHGSSLSVPPSQPTQSALWGIDPTHRNHGFQTWFSGQHVAGGPAIHVGAQLGGPQGAVVHGAQAPQSTPSTAGPMPAQPPQGNLASVPANGGLPVNLMWSNAGAAYPLFLAAQAQSASAAPNSSALSAGTALPRQGGPNLDGLQSQLLPTALSNQFANPMSVSTMQPTSFPISYAPPGPFPPTSGGEQQAFNDPFLGQGDMSLL